MLSRETRQKALVVLAKSLLLIRVFSGSMLRLPLSDQSKGELVPSTSAPGPRDLFKCYHNKKRPLSIFFLIRSSELSEDGSYHFLYTLS